MEVDWMTAVKRGPDLTQAMLIRDVAWTTAVRADAELAGEVPGIGPLTHQERDLLTRVRDLAYSTVNGEGDPDPDTMEGINQCMRVIARIRQQKARG